MTFNYKIATALLLTGSLTFSSCVKDFEELNTSPNDLEAVTPAALLTPTIYEMATYFTVRSNDFTWELMQVGLTHPSAANDTHRYFMSETSGDGTWNTCYNNLRNIYEMELAAEAEGEGSEVYRAVAATLRAYVAGILTDSFGDVPLSEALRAEDGITQPKFDTQEQIYADMVAALEEANTIYAGDSEMVGDDILYQNNKERWRKFNNSLLLRYYLRQSKRIDAYSKIKAILDNPEAYPIFESNEEAAMVSISGNAPYDYAWGRRQDYVNFTAMAEFFVDHLNALDDPRRPYIMTEASRVNGEEVTLLGYKGVQAAHAGDLALDYNPSTPNGELVYPDAVGTPVNEIILPYAEVEFIKAETYWALGLDAEAKEAYEKGVQASIEQYGATMPEDYFQREAAAYNGTLEQIMLQKYFALFMVDYQQWFEYRRTGYPELPKTPYMLYDGVMPTRFMYKNDVRRFNPENYEKAVQQMGGDDFHTKVWWEK